MKRLGLFGGTFDPVHNAHLRLALELKQLCQLDAMHLVPAHIPPHRGQPHCSPKQRTAMLQLALSHCPHLSVDSRELHRHSPSYTVDTLAEVKRDVGDDVALYLCIGVDSLQNLHTWHRWQSLFDYANLVVSMRPGYTPPSSGPVAEFIAGRRVDARAIAASPAGKIMLAQTSLLEISASYIRAEIAAGRSAQFLLPDLVWQYIVDNGLYC